MCIHVFHVSYVCGIYGCLLFLYVDDIIIFKCTLEVYIFFSSVFVYCINEMKYHFSCVHNTLIELFHCVTKSKTNAPVPANMYACQCVILLVTKQIYLFVKKIYDFYHLFLYKCAFVLYCFIFVFPLFTFFRPLSFSFF